MSRDLDEALKVADETLVAYRPVLPLPPADLETRRTDLWKPVTFLSQPIRYPADRPLPRDCPHSIATQLEELSR